MITTDPLYFRSRSAINLITNIVDQQELLITTCYTVQTTLYREEILLGIKTKGPLARIGVSSVFYAKCVKFNKAKEKRLNILIFIYLLFLFNKPFGSITFPLRFKVYCSCNLGFQNVKRALLSQPQI